MKATITGLFIACLATTAFGQNPNGRVSLVETFTSSTCPPCNQGNSTLEGFLANPANDDETVSLKYQMSWPSTGDPYFTDEGDTRRNFYSVSSIPQTHIDAQFGGNPANLTQASFNTQYAIDPVMNIEAYYQVNESSQTVDVQVDLEALQAVSVGNRVYVAIFEYTTYNNVKTNGETEFYHVMKKMIPGATGQAFPSMAQGATNHYEFSYTFNGSYVLPPNATQPVDDAIEHSVEEFSDLGVAVWVQNVTTKEILQAGYAINGYSPSGLEENETMVTSLNLYPNPAASTTTIAFDLAEVQDVRLQVYNLLGQRVINKMLTNNKVGRNTNAINTTDLHNGVYTVELLIGNIKKSKRLIVRN